MLHDRYGLKSWIEAARKRLHHNVLAIALANKLARIAWAVLHKGRAFECVKTREDETTMEDRSSRRVRTLVTRKARRGLSANKIACALISMMAGAHAPIGDRIH